MLNTIYLITNIAIGKVYVGQTWQTLQERWDNGNAYKSCLLLNRAIQKYGKENFRHEILTLCSTQETADYWEIYFIRKYDSTNPQKGYNIREGGSRGKHSEVSKARMSEAQYKRAKPTQETLLKSQ